MTYQEKTNLLYDEQVINWPLLRQNIEGLNSVRLKSFEFSGFTINVQFNPKRITSSAAKVDKTSISNRKCFLCSAHRPKEQNMVPFERDYEILCNPFPIFNKHYTIAHKNHIVQEIGSSFSDMLDLSCSLKELVLFYNAPKCGASAPDHLHFQAGNHGLMPIEKDLEGLIKIYSNPVVSTSELSVNAIDDTLRRALLIESSDKQKIEDVFQLIYTYTQNLSGGEEPMLNILSYFEGGWKVLVFPRDKHRPWQYFEEGVKNILLSPASVDMGGTLITPLEKDFLKISKEDIVDIFKQVSISPERFDGLLKHIKTSFT